MTFIVSGCGSTYGTYKLVDTLAHTDSLMMKNKYINCDIRCKNEVI